MSFWVSEDVRRRSKKKKGSGWSESDDGVKKVEGKDDVEVGKLFLGELVDAEEREGVRLACG
ncbi:hypothetical protein TSUD_391460 [Trifolium subterraneum]|uniref:Uncharacterized protein n=1 Tax=Trifolium subterraneum TaxID=3900 RepID=A0A2Z6MX80_TRISU|nr:hypothetical protein TSUD_391460 [Trifolium subterraneum]